MTIFTEDHKKWPLYRQLHKCGELTASADQRFFGLNCNFCSIICSRLDVFIKHIKAEHASAVESLYRSQIEAEVDNSMELGLKVCSPEMMLHSVKEAEIELNLKSGIAISSELLVDPFEETPRTNLSEKVSLETVYIKEETIVSGCNDTVDSEESDPDNNESDNCSDSDYEAEADAVIENRDILTTIIEFYEQNSVLWNTKHPEYLKAYIKLNYIQKLVADIDSKHKLKVTPKAVRRSFSGLWTLYRKELRGDENNDLLKHEDVSLKSKLWCFEKLRFLQQETVPVRKLLHVLSNIQLIELGKIYQQYPAAWNLELVESRKKTLKKETFQKMLEQTCVQLKLDITYSQLLLHLRRLKNIYISDKRKRLKCELDNCQFKPKNPKLYEQLSFLDAHLGPFRCEKCNEIINAHDQFRVHVAAHEGLSGFTCKLCNKGYSSFGSLEVHMRRHKGENPFQCPFCERAFSSSTDCKTHQRIHTGDKPYVCHFCGKSFRSNSFLCRHLLQVHNPETLRYKCPHCPKKFIQSEKLKSHINVHLQFREHVCGECGKGFFARKTLQQHMQLHSDIMKYSCDICGKKFKQIPAMYSHKKTHKN